MKEDLSPSTPHPRPHPTERPAGAIRKSPNKARFGAQSPNDINESLSPSGLSFPLWGMGRGEKNKVGLQNASLTRWPWVWINSRSWWWTGRPGMLRSMGSQRVRHDWATELSWTKWLVPPLLVSSLDSPPIHCIFFLIIILIAQVILRTPLWRRAFLTVKSRFYF